MLPVGVAGGLCNFALESAAALSTLGFVVSLDPSQIAFYAFSGVVLAFGVGLPWGLVRWLRRGGEPTGRLPVGLAIALVVAGLQAAAMLERVSHAFFRHSAGFILLAWVATLLAFVAWLGILAWLFSGQRPFSATTPASPWLFGGSSAAWPVSLGALMVAAGLAVNRNLIPEITSRAALGTDVAIVLATAFLAWLLGRSGGRRPLVAVALAGILAASAFWGHRPPPPRSTSAAQSPHLVLAVIDTLRQDVFRSVLDETPEGQAFLRRVGGAAWFENAVAAAPWTAPSVATIMTGLWPPEHGYGYQERVSQHIRLTRLTPEVRTLAEMLEARGFSTTALVANPVLGIGSGLERGFERFELLSGRTSQMPLLTVGHRLKLMRRELYLDATGVRRRLARHLPSLAADARPAFLWLHLMDPHAPHNFHKELPADPAFSGQGLEAAYRQETRYALAELHRMIDLLEKHGMWQDSVFMLVSDHGEMFNSDDRGDWNPSRGRGFAHGHALFGELVRIPLVIRPPGGLDAERRPAVLTSHVDILSTLEDLLEVDLPLATADRYSLAPWLGPDSQGPSARRFALIGANHSGAPQQALRGRDRKLIRYLGGRPKVELFDLEQDPGERRDLSAEESETTAEMGRMLELAWGSLDRAESEAVELDAETREQLRALGYLD